MKRIALRTVAALTVVVASAAITPGVVDAGGPKRSKTPATVCEQDCPPAPAPTAARGIRW